MEIDVKDFIKKWGSFDTDYEVTNYAPYSWPDVASLISEAFELGVKKQQAKQRLQTRRANQQAKDSMDRQ